MIYAECRDGEIGRRSGLKIRRGESSVGVRFPLPAPQLLSDCIRFTSASLGLC